MNKMYTRNIISYYIVDANDACQSVLKLSNKIINGSLF